MKSTIKAISFSFLIAGTLDGIAAVIILGKNNFAGVWKYVASGFFGVKAFKSGHEMVFYGILFHFFIALTWTTIYYFSFRKLNFFKTNRIIGGLVYGIIIWLNMNLIILPQTNIPQSTKTFVDVVKGVIILMGCVGLPISILTNLNYTNGKTANR